MPITALPPESIRSIGSIQALTDPCSLVKELIDNSLDAQASTIAVELSLNTLDVVQVKDNGHGIFPADRSMICRRYCTSKIRCFDDIENIGGKSLGFRGEALASAAEMSGGMVVSTRIEGETTAVSLAFTRRGEIEKEVRVSQPIGTTIRIIEFLKNLPVRRQTAVKASAKSIVKIKTLLHAYAFARPSVRFSLKVLKAKNDKSNWIYAPANGDTVLNAAIKIAGKRLVDQCQWEVWTSPTKDNGRNAPDETNEEGHGESYVIEALVPSPMCNASIVSNFGQYVAIDARPVSHTRGTLKQIATLYKSYMGSRCAVEGVNKVKDPFLCVNIVCPSNSYDANIEPAKDDVLFTNADLVLTVFENFLKSIYGELRRPPAASTHSRSSEPNPRSFDLLLARKPVSSVSKSSQQKSNGDGADIGPPLNIKLSLTASNSLQPIMHRTGVLLDHEESDLDSRSFSPDRHIVGTSPVADCQAVGEQNAAERMRGWQQNMCGAEEEDFCDPRSPGSTHDDTTQQQGNQFSDGEDSLRDARISNPWVFAKINAPVRQSNMQKKGESNVEANDQLPTPGRQIGELAEATTRQVQETTQESDGCSFGLPTPKHTQGHHAAPELPQTSFPPDPFPFPQKAWARGGDEHASRQHAMPKRFSNDPGVLDTWLQKPVNRRSGTASSALDDDLHNHNETVEVRARDFVSARTLPTGTPFGAVPEKGKKHNRRSVPRKQQGINLNKPFVSPVNDPERVRFELEPNRKGTPHSSRTKSVADSTAASTPTRLDSEDHGSLAEETVQSSSPMHPDLAATMDYENRKQAALQHWKGKQRQNDMAKELLSNPQVEVSQSPATVSPHKNRYSQAVAALHSSDDDEVAVNAHLSAFEPGDPRIHLICPYQAFRNSSSTRAPKRRRTGMLPLETVQESSTTRDLVLVADIKRSETVDLLTASKMNGMSCDEYISSGINAGAFSSCTIQQIRAWEAKIRELTQKTYGEEGAAGGGRSAGLHIDLWACLQTHREMCS